MPRNYVRNNAQVFHVSVNDRLSAVYTNLKAAYDHFNEIVQPGYTSPLSYSQLARKFHKIDEYVFISLDHIKYSISFHIAYSKFNPENFWNHVRNSKKGSPLK